MKYKIIYKGDDPITELYLHQSLLSPSGTVVSWNECIEDWEEVENQELYEIVILE